MHGLAAVVGRHVDTVRASNPHEVPTIEAAARLVPRLLTELGLGEFLGALLIDEKPRLLLHFRLHPASPLSPLGRDVVLKIYGDQPRGEGPLLALWRARGANTPRVRFGERDGCSWLALEHMILSGVRPRGRDELLTLTEEVAAEISTLQAPAPRLTPVLRSLHGVMLPRWDASVAALHSAGHRVPSGWRPRAATAYGTGRPRPLHGDLGLTNVARNHDGRLVIYDASALIGPQAFDAARWAARLAGATVAPGDLLDRWAAVAGGTRNRAADELLAAECVLEAGALEIVRARGQAADPADDHGPDTSAARLLTSARALLGD